MTTEIHISEIFGPTIQGEGPLIGQPTIFVRTAGCDYRCSWCDTLYAVLPEYRDEWTFMKPVEILAQVDALADNRPVLVSISGGNPALQPRRTTGALRAENRNFRRRGLCICARCRGAFSPRSNVFAGRQSSTVAIEKSGRS